MVLVSPGWSRHASMINAADYEECLTLCQDRYDGCKFGNQNAPLMDTACTNYCMACNVTCSRQFPQMAD